MGNEKKINDNSYQRISCKKLDSAFFQGVGNKLKSVRSLQKATLLTLVLLANVAWISPSYGGKHADEVRNDAENVQHKLIGFRGTIQTPENERAWLGPHWGRRWNSLGAALNSLFELVTQKAQSYDQCLEDLSATQNSRATCIQENHDLVEVITQTEQSRDQYREELIATRNSRDTYIQENHKLIEVITQTEQLRDQCFKDLNTTRNAGSICLQKNHELAEVLTQTEKLLGQCNDEKNTLTTNYSAKIYEQQAELENYKNQLTWYKDRVNIGLVSFKTGAISSVIPEIIRDGVKYGAIHFGNCTAADADKYANYAATTAMVLKTGVIAYNAPLYALSGIALPYIAGKVVSGSLDYCYGATSPESITGGSTVSLLTSFAQDYFYGQNTLLDHSIAFGGYWAGSTLGMQAYGGMKKLVSSFYGPAAVPAGAAAGGGAPGGNGGPGPNDGSDDDSGEDSSNGSSPTRKSQAFAEKFTSLQPLLAQLSIMNLDLDSAALEDMQLLMQNSVLLRKAIEREPLSQEIIVPQLNNFKATLENLKRLVEVAPALEESNVEVLNLLKNLEHSAKNIIGISQI